MSLWLQAKQTPSQGVMLVAFMSAVCSAINWGFGLVVGALFAREVARRIPKSDYRLLIASAYIGFLTWHGGLSGSVPLVAATKGNPMEATIGLIPISQTLFTPYNIFITVALIVTLPFICKMMQPKEDEFVAVDASLLAEAPDTSKVLSANATWAERMEESPLLSMLVGALGIVYLITYFMKNGFNINVNTVNLIFFTAGIILHKTPMSYMRAVSNAARGTAGIMIQFPLYAGIQIMMEHSGLGGIITNWFISISSKDTFVGLGVRDIMGYCVTALVWSLFIFIIGLYFF